MLRRRAAIAVSGGHIVGNYRDPDNSIHSYYFDGSQFTTIDPPGTSFNFADGVSGSDVVGWYDSNRMHGFLYDGSTFTAIDMPDSASTSVFGISDGSLYGYYVDGIGRMHGFVSNGSTSTTVDMRGAVETQIIGVSGGYVLGTYVMPGTPDQRSASGAFVYDGSTFTTLDLPGGANAIVTGISGNTIVGHHGGAGFEFQFTAPISSAASGGSDQLSSGPDSLGQDPSAPDSPGPNSSGQGSSEQDLTEPDSTGKAGLGLVPSSPVTIQPLTSLLGTQPDPAGGSVTSSEVLAPRVLLGLDGTVPPSTGARDDDTIYGWTAAE